jgi:hypothetical protein
MDTTTATTTDNRTIEQIRQDLDDVANGRLPRHAMAEVANAPDPRYCRNCGSGLHTFCNR